MEALGINVVNMFINFVLFMAFFAIIHKVVGKKLSTILSERQNVVSQTLEQSKKAQELLESAQLESDRVITNTRKEAEKIIIEARNLSEIESRENLQKVEQEAVDIRKKANAVLSTYQKKLDAEFEAKVESTVKTALEKLVRENPEFTK
jgi:F-type H+-transporting ATPase subunit b